MLPSFDPGEAHPPTTIRFTGAVHWQMQEPARIEAMNPSADFMAALYLRDRLSAAGLYEVCSVRLSSQRAVTTTICNRNKASC